MSNPASVGVGTAYGPAICVTSTSPASVVLDANKTYQLFHNGVNNTGSADTNIIMCAVGSATAAVSEGANKFLLLDGRDPLFLGPGISTLIFDAKAGVPTFSIIPLGTDFGAH